MLIPYPFSVVKTLVLYSLVSLMTTGSLYSSETKVSCGEIIGGEFAEARGSHDYLLMMKPGEVIKFRTVPTGDFLKFRARAQDPVGNDIYYTGHNRNDMQHRLNVETGKLSAQGTYRITLWNHNANNNDIGHVGIFTLHIGCILNDGTEIEPGSQNKHAEPPITASDPPLITNLQIPGSAPKRKSSTVEKINEYAQMADDAVVAAEGIVNVASTLRDLWPKRKRKQNQPAMPPPGWQTTAPPGWPASSLVAPPTQPQAITPPPHSAPSVAPLQPTATVAPLQPTSNAPTNVQGFPGLTPSDLSALQLPSIALGQELQGSILAIGHQIAGFGFAASPGTAIDLAFERTAGNMDLGLLLLDPSRQIAFQTSLVVNHSFNTRLVIPSQGEYTLGIAKIKPLPPTPTATSFKIHLVPAQTALAPVQQLTPATPQPTQVPLQPTASSSSHRANVARPKGITLYEHANYQGIHETFYTDDPTLTDNRIGKNSASSIRVDPGCQVLLYKQVHFKGPSFALTWNVENLRSLKIANDSVSSLHVQCE